MKPADEQVEKQTVPELVQFNSFGLVKVTRYEISVTITAMTRQGKAISRALVQEFDAPMESIGEDEFLSALFGALIEPKGSRIMYDEIVALPDLPQIGKIAGVSQALAKAIDMVRKVQG